VFVRVAWVVVLTTAILRLVVAARLPLSGDEAYYWEWSRRLAFGYIDHPPMVAWLIALFTLGTKSAFLVRLPFVLCGVGAAICLSAYATRAACDVRAGATAALFLALAPFATIAFTMASPDGPELFFWSASLYCALRSLDDARWRVPLALACAATLLSSVLGAFVIAGIISILVRGVHQTNARDKRAGPDLSAWVAGILFLICIAPYFFWDASHGWPALRFALIGRHVFIPVGNFVTLIALFAAVLTPGVFIAMGPVIVRLLRGRSLGGRLLLVTSFPLLVVCIALSLRENVEFYWANGAWCSLVGALGVYAVRMFHRASFAAIIGQAVALASFLFIVAALPLQSLHFGESVLGVHLRNQGAFEIWAYEPAARDVAREARADGAIVMTDGYGLSSVLDFYADIPPVVIGYDAQGREARSWIEPFSQQAIFFDKEPLASRPDFKMQLARACKIVTDDGIRSYFMGDQLTRTFYLTRCAGLTPDGFSLLLFPNKSQS
jgi:hypothetical protein